MKQNDIMVRVNRDTHAWLSQVRRELSVKRGEDLSLANVVALGLMALTKEDPELAKNSSREPVHA